MYLVKDFRALLAGCFVCLMAEMGAAATGHASATITATGVIPSTCHVGSAAINLSPLNASRITGSAPVELASTGPTTFSLSPLTLSSPVGSNVTAYVTVASPNFFMGAASGYGNSRDVSAPINASSGGVVQAYVYSSIDAQPLPAGNYQISATFSCISL